MSGYTFVSFRDLSECLRQQMLMDVMGEGINGVFFWMEDGIFERTVDEMWEEEETHAKG